MLNSPTGRAIDHLDLPPFSPGWYRAFKAEHLRRYPHLVDEPHQNSIRNLDLSIARAERLAREGRAQ